MKLMTAAIVLEKREVIDHTKLAHLACTIHNEL